MKIPDSPNQTQPLQEMNRQTTALVAVVENPNLHQEFGRHADVRKAFGLKRGTLYNLLKAGRIRSILLRVRGQKSGVRLFDMQSIRELIRTQMEQGNSD